MNKWAYFSIGILLIAVSVGVRMASYPVVSADFTASISPWLQTLLYYHGLSAFKIPFADYAPLYLYLLKPISLIPGNGLYAVKTLSGVFDILVAVISGLIMNALFPRRYSWQQLFFFGAIMFALPTIILNSSLWAQCDAMYAGFIVLSLYFVIKDKSWLAVIMFALALAFKIQALFFVPFLLGFVFTKKLAAVQILVIPAVFILLILPAAWGGGSFTHWLAIYAVQSGEFPELALHAPTIYSFLNESALSPSVQTVLSCTGIMISAIIAVLILIAVRKSIRAGTFTRESILFFALASVVLIPFFLPHMHERYFYLADIISVLYACAVPRRWHIPVIIVSVSFFSYMPFLSDGVRWFGNLIVPEFILGILMLVPVVFLGLGIFRSLRIGKLGHTKHP